MSRTKRNQPEYSFFDDEKRGRDLKPRYKPPGWFKKGKRRKERAIAKQALRQGFEPDLVLHSDVWDWN